MASKEKELLARYLESCFDDFDYIIPLAKWINATDYKDYYVAFEDGDPYPVSIYTSKGRYPLRTPTDLISDGYITLQELADEFEEGIKAGNINNINDLEVFIDKCAKADNKPDNDIKSTPTPYGERLLYTEPEIQWHRFLANAHANFEIRPETFLLPNGKKYRPTFKVYDVPGRVNGTLYIDVLTEVTPELAENIQEFTAPIHPDRFSRLKNKLLVVSQLPDPFQENVDAFISRRGYDYLPGFSQRDIYPFNFETIDSDHFAAHPGINKRGQFEVFGDDSSYLCEQDDEATDQAYIDAREKKHLFERAVIGKPLSK